MEPMLTPERVSQVIRHFNDHRENILGDTPDKYSQDISGYRTELWQVRTKVLEILGDIGELIAKLDGCSINELLFRPKFESRVLPAYPTFTKEDFEGIDLIPEYQLYAMMYEKTLCN